MNRYGESCARPSGPLTESDPTSPDWTHDPRSTSSLESHSQSHKNQLSDGEIRQKILAQLTQKDIEVRVKEGVVVLSGWVNSREEKVAVQEKIQSLGIAFDIFNQLQIF